MTHLHDLTAVEQGKAIAAGEVTSVELTEHYLDRVERLDQVGAFITVTPDAALRVAAQIDAAGSLGERGPLAGVPTAIKDLNPTRGIRTTFGSAAFADFVPEFSDNIALSIAAAQMPSLGKTNTPEFGSPSYTEPAVAPAALTPWDLTRGAGGSSGGAAAAVAAGLVPVAQGSDGGGSIRIPASCCGLVGFKPSRGVVSGAPTYGDPIGLSTSGPIARTVADAAAFLDVIAGHRVGDPTWATPLRPGRTFLGEVVAGAQRERPRLKIARFIAPVIAEVVPDPQVVVAWEESSVFLESLGHEVVDITVPLPPESVPYFELCWAVSAAMSVLDPAAEEKLRPLTRWLRELGGQVSAAQYGLAIGQMRRYAAEAIIALDPYDAVLTPTLAQLPAKVGALRNDADPAADFEAQKQFTPWTSAWNVTGMPSVSLPMAWSAEGLPIGMMLAGRPGADVELLQLSGQIEAAHGGLFRRPSRW